MESGFDILVRYRKRWKLKLWIQVFLYALGPSIFIHFLFLKLFISLFTGMMITAIMITIIKPWKYSLSIVADYIDQHLDAAEYSTGLLLIPDAKLSNLARLQKHKVAKGLVKKGSTIKPPGNFILGSIVLGLFISIGFGIYKYQLIDYFRQGQEQKITPERIVFKPVDSAATKILAPILVRQELTIRYPDYTRTPPFKTSKMDIKAIEGSQVSWKIQFDKEVANVTMEHMGNTYPMRFIDSVYTRNIKIHTSGFYNFKFTDTQGNSYISELYSVENVKDKSPDIEIQGIKQFTSFSFDENKNISFMTAITDDFGIADAYIIATVSKGSGESVKFREEKLNFDSGIPPGGKKLNMSKKIDLDEMNMEPGDELYFYVEASDYKKPKPNRSRSETFFAVIKDTVSDEFAVEGTMGVDLMPDYFRSQRQLIIDTEKLISDRLKLSKKDFKSKSNELGFDQKVLRLKYAQFMGDESAHKTIEEEDAEILEREDDHSDKDPLAGYTHTHDHENEHNLVEESEEDHKDPLEEYVHNHEDPEESTLFTQSLKSKLRQALNQMWDAELYLRLYTPEKSLPYQYSALKLIQEIKNSARIYVHRIGFDPPPIKEDKRLTGKIDGVTSYRKHSILQKKDKFPSIRKTVSRLEQLIVQKGMITDKDRLLFQEAGNELAIKAIEDPGRYLKTLKKLKWATENIEISVETLIEIQKGLFSALPALRPTPSKKKMLTSEINELLLKELEIHD